MAQVTITLTDMGPTALDVGINSNPPLPESAIMMSNAQLVAMDIVKQLQAASKAINSARDHKNQMDALKVDGSLSGKV